MGVADKIAPRGFNLIHRHIGLNAQHVIGITVSIGHKLRADTAKAAGIKAPNFSNTAQELILVWMIFAVGQGDVKQPFHQVAKRCCIAVIHRANALRVIFKTCDILAGKVKDAGGVGLLGARNVEYLAEGGHLVAGHFAVGFGHLGTQRNHRNCKRNRAVWRRAQFFKNRREPLAFGQGRDRVRYAGPD